MKKSDNFADKHRIPKTEEIGRIAAPELTKIAAV